MLYITQYIRVYKKERGQEIKVISMVRFYYPKKYVGLLSTS